MARLRDASGKHDPLARLTPHERSVLELIGEDLTNRQIGERLFLAEKTVKNYVSTRQPPGVPARSSPDREPGEHHEIVTSARYRGKGRPGAPVYRAAACRTRSFSVLTRHDDTSLCIVRFVRGGDHRAVHARPAGPARLREAINTRLEETSSGTALAACAAALLLIVAAVAVALLVSGHGTAGGQGTAADAAPSDPAGTAATPVAMPAAPPRPRATAVPSASPDQAASSPAASSPAANPTAPATKPAPSATRSPPRCPPGHARHHRC